MMLSNIGVYLAEAIDFYASFGKSVATNYYVSSACSVTTLVLYVCGWLPTAFAVAVVIAGAIILKRGRERYIDEDFALHTATHHLRRAVALLDWLGGHSGATLILRLLLSCFVVWFTFLAQGLGLMCWLLAFNWMAANNPKLFEFPRMKRRPKGAFSRQGPALGNTDSIPVGFLGNLTPVQQEALERFRGQVEAKLPAFHQSFGIAPDSLEVDRLCLRFLRMQKFNEELAFRACVRCVEWRDDFQGVGVKNVTAAMCQKELDRNKLQFNGYLEGMPVFWLRPHVHTRQETDPKMLELTAVYLMEKEVLPRLQTHLLGPAGEMVTLVMDLSLVTRANLDLEGAKQLAATFQQYYPEYLHTALLIEPTKLFMASWKVMMRGWFEPTTLGKMQFIKQEEIDDWLPKESMAA